MTNKAIVGEKLGMTQIWDDQNQVIPVTVLRVSPCRVVQVKTPKNDGYSAIQVTIGYRDEAKLSQPEAGHFSSAGVEPGRKLLELRIDDVSEYSVGQSIAADVLVAGERVDVTAISRGKGFSGVMKRHGFKGSPATHGAHKVHRKPGAIGQCATPSRVFRGRKMPGRAGSQKVTTLNLEVIKSDPNAEVVLVRGSVPGPAGGTVIVRNAVKG